MKWPAKLTGGHSLVPWLNQLLESAKSCQINPGVGYRINSQSLSGTVLGVTAGGPAGNMGWMLVDGKKLYGDPTVNSYKKNQVVKILESDSIVTTGIVCLGSFSATKAVAGKWVCLQDVPVLLNDGTDDPAYIPTVPADSGSLDPDNTGNYWEFITPSSICAGGSTVTI